MSLLNMLTGSFSCHANKKSGHIVLIIIFTPSQGLLESIMTLNIEAVVCQIHWLMVYIGALEVYLFNSLRILKDPRKRPDAPKEECNEEEEEQKLRQESGLTRTGRLFGGLMNDIKRKAPW